MITKEYSTLGYDVGFSVPETSEEFNKNAWKADTGEGNPVLDEAINNVIYRGVLNIFRDRFLHGLDEVKDGDKIISAKIVGVEELTGIDRVTKEVKGKDGKTRMKDGEPVLAYDETEQKFFDRVLLTLVKNGKFASEDLARASFLTLSKTVAASIPFDAAARERSFAGPRKLPAKYKLTAARIIAAGNVAGVNAKYLVKIGKAFAPAEAVPGEEVKLFQGSYEAPQADGTVLTKTVEVPEKDAEALGWLLKEYNDWEASQRQDEMANLATAEPAGQHGHGHEHAHAH